MCQRHDMPVPRHRRRRVIGSLRGQRSGRYPPERTAPPVFGRANPTRGRHKHEPPRCVRRRRSTPSLMRRRRGRAPLHSTTPHSGHRDHQTKRRDPAELLRVLTFREKFLRWANAAIRMRTAVDLKSREDFGSDSRPSAVPRRDASLGRRSAESPVAGGRSLCVATRPHGQGSVRVGVSAQPTRRSALQGITFWNSSGLKRASVPRPTSEKADSVSAICYLNRQHWRTGPRRLSGLRRVAPQAIKALKAGPKRAVGGGEKSTVARSEPATTGSRRGPDLTLGPNCPRKEAGGQPKRWPPREERDCREDDRSDHRHPRGDRSNCGANRPERPIWRSSLYRRANNVCAISHRLLPVATAPVNGKGARGPLVGRRTLGRRPE